MEMFQDHRIKNETSYSYFEKIKVQNEITFKSILLSHFVYKLGTFWVNLPIFKRLFSQSQAMEFDTYLLTLISCMIILSNQESWLTSQKDRVLSLPELDQFLQAVHIYTFTD